VRQQPVRAGRRHSPLRRAARRSGDRHRACRVRAGDLPALRRPELPGRRRDCSVSPYVRMLASFKGFDEQSPLTIDMTVPAGEGPATYTIATPGASGPHVGDLDAGTLLPRRRALPVRWLRARERAARLLGAQL